MEHFYINTHPRTFLTCDSPSPHFPPAVSQLSLTLPSSIPSATKILLNPLLSPEPSCLYRITFDFIYPNLHRLTASRYSVELSFIWTSSTRGVIALESACNYQPPQIITLLDQLLFV